MQEKAETRKEMLARRKALSPAERHEKSAQILKEVLSLSEYQTSHTVMVYLDFRDEVETTELAEQILRDGKMLLIPFCKPESTELIPCDIFNLSSDLQPGMWGIREPHPEKVKPISPKEIDLVVVPGVAFDLQGNRIGFGKGYYDRFLPQLRQDAIAIGVAFSCQLLEEIPAESYDYKMSLLITENGVIYHT